jgi:hypothetical protein
MTKTSAKSFAPVRSAFRFATAVGVLAGVVCGTSEAHAQGWLADRRFAEGPGIRTGDLELHPGIGGEVGYDSNWFLRSSNTGTNLVNGAPVTPVRDAAVLRLTPSFYVATLGEQRSGEGQETRVEPRFLTFRGGISATGRYFIGKEMSDQQNIALDADARADLNRGHPISAGFFGAFVRTVQPQTQSDPNLSFTHDDIRLGGDVTFLPGGGNLDLGLGYQFAPTFYEESNAVAYSSISHIITFRDRWKFRPRTAVFSEGTLSFVSYPNSTRATFLLNDSTPLRTRAGLNGLLTNWFGATLAGGYSATFFKSGNLASTSQYDSFNAQAEAEFFLSPGNTPDEPGAATLLLSTFTFGFSRDYQRSLVGNYLTDDQLYARLEYWFGSRVVLNVSLRAERLDYPDVFATNGLKEITPGFTNYRLDGLVFAEYRFSQVFGLNTTIEYTRQFSETLIPAGPLPGNTVPAFFDQNYGHLQAFLGFRYFY